MYVKSYTENGKMVRTREGGLWLRMNSRCNHLQLYPSYVGCRTSENFKNFQYFAEWCNKQKGFLEKNENGTHWALDKDLLGNGKIYSEDVCVFIPYEINGFLVNMDKNVRSIPTGVTFDKSRGLYKAKMGEKYNLGRFETYEEAAEVYKVAKERYAKDLAMKYDEKLDKRVYEYLMSFKVKRNTYEVNQCH